MKTNAQRLTLIAVALLATSVPSQGQSVPAQTAVDSLNAFRVMNGIPPLHQIDSNLSRGCVLHSRYMRTAKNYKPGPNFAPHMEIAGEPGATSLGATAAESSNLHGGTNTEYPRRVWQQPGRHIWQDAPLHEAGLLTPDATTAWYGDHAGRACMGVGGFRQREHPEPFYAAMANGRTNVPTETYVYSEWPYNPATRVGLPLGTKIGPVIYLFETARGSLRSVTLVGPEGEKATRLDKEGSGSHRMVFIPKPLRAHSIYTLTAHWQHADSPSLAVQTVTFTTGKGPLPQIRTGVQDPDIRLVSLRKTGARSATFHIDPGNAIGQRARIQYRFQQCDAFWRCETTSRHRTMSIKLRPGRNSIRLALPPAPRRVGGRALMIEAALYVPSFMRDTYRHWKYGGAIYRRY